MPEWSFPPSYYTLCKIYLSLACHVILTASRCLKYHLSWHQNWSGRTLIQLVPIAELFLVSVRPAHPRSSPQLGGLEGLRSYINFAKCHAGAPGSPTSSGPQALGLGCSHCNPGLSEATLMVSGDGPDPFSSGHCQTWESPAFIWQ